MGFFNDTCIAGILAEGAEKTENFLKEIVCFPQLSLGSTLRPCGLVLPISMAGMP